jgi:hypothetical protein
MLRVRSRLPTPIVRQWIRVRAKTKASGSERIILFAEQDKRDWLLQVIKRRTWRPGGGWEKAVGRGHCLEDWGEVNSAISDQ